MTKDRFCMHLIHLIHAPIHVYDKDWRQTAVFLDKGEQQDVLDMDPEFCRMLLEKSMSECPLLHIENQNIIYGIAAVADETYFIGPCCLRSDTNAAVRYLVHTHKLDPKKPYHVSYSPFETFSSVVLMLYEFISDEIADVNQLWLNSFYGEQIERGTQEKAREVFYHYQENGIIHNPYSQEIREQASIRKGDLEGLKESFQETYMGTVGTLSHDNIRNCKNLMIVVITLASRSAIEGGVLPEIAYSLSDAYILKLEELSNEGQIIALGRQAEIDYCRLVRDISNPRHRQNPLVARCKELVLQNLHTKISVNELAAQMDVNPDYLSALFSKENGITLTNYIAREKVNFSKRELAYTDDSYAEIAFTFGFASQSHYGRVFKKWTDMTPKQYREGHRRNTK